jgi:hypothetical protein
LSLLCLGIFKHFTNEKGDCRTADESCSPIEPQIAKDTRRRAGANDLAGFIDAPEMNARKKISRPTSGLNQPEYIWLLE